MTSRGPLPFLNRRMTFEYRDRGLVGTPFGAPDRLPGLHVGQRWDERIANPLTTRYWSTTPYRFGSSVMKFSVVPAEFAPGAPARAPDDSSYEGLVRFLITTRASSLSTRRPTVIGSTSHRPAISF